MKNLKKSVIAISASLLIAGLTPFSAAAFPYQVKEKDSLWKIARAHGVSLESLKQANPKVNPHNLHIGQAVDIPVESSVNGGSYVVENDEETFWTIAKKVNVDVYEFMAANRGIDAKNLYAGIVLNLPKKESAPSFSSDGDSLQYAKVITAKATAYSGSIAENKWGAVDYFGNALKFGTIAVDPKVIPLGSKVYVTGASFDGVPQDGFIGTALDMGSAVKGNRIDIFLPAPAKKVRQFGFQEVTVYILK